MLDVNKLVFQFKEIEKDIYNVDSNVKGVKVNDLRLTPSDNIEVLFSYEGKNYRKIEPHPKKRYKKVKTNLKDRAKKLKYYKSFAGMILAGTIIIAGQTWEFQEEIKPLIEEQETPVKVEEMALEKEIIFTADDVKKAFDTQKDFIDHWNLDTIDDMELRNFVYAVNVDKIPQEEVGILLEKNLVSNDFQEVVNDFFKVVAHTAGFNDHMTKSHEFPYGATIPLFPSVLDKDESSLIKELDNKGRDVRTIRSDSERSNIEREVLKNTLSQEFGNNGIGVQALAVTYPDNFREYLNNNMGSNELYPSFDDYKEDVRNLFEEEIKRKLDNTKSMSL